MFSFSRCIFLNYSILIFWTYTSRGLQQAYCVRVRSSIWHDHSGAGTSSPHLTSKHKRAEIEAAPKGGVVLFPSRAFRRPCGWDVRAICRRCAGCGERRVTARKSETMDGEKKMGNLGALTCGLTPQRGSCIKRQKKCLCFLNQTCLQKQASNGRKIKRQERGGQD